VDTETEARLHLVFQAARLGSKVAVASSGGQQITYEQLDRASSRLARALRGLGLNTGDTVAILMENHPRYLEVAWAAQRTGLRYVPVNWHLLAEETAYVLENSQTLVLFTTRAQAQTVATSRWKGNLVTVSVDGQTADSQSLDEFVAGESEEPLPAQWEIEGTEMLYSSGTTGRPKGIRKPLTAAPPGDTSVSQVRGAANLNRRYGQNSTSVSLIPAPLYHSAPLTSAMASTRLGSTTVVMDKFDAIRCLELIEEHRVTHAQFVPTMFVRLLRLSRQERSRYDLSSLRCVLHGAAPCPVDVKRKMIEWLGPIIYEYYGGTEEIGSTMIDSDEWLAHPGSVGRAPAGVTLHILDVDDRELQPRQTGRVFMEGGQIYEYHQDAEKTSSVIGPDGWRTLGDIGWLDEDGYLYLTDRASDMIVSGGVNIYPQEIEDVLGSHPDVFDVAVISVPNAEYGEEVRAVVQVDGIASAGATLEQRLLAHCRMHLASYKCPRAVDFVDQIPRDPNGKLYRRRLREQYWSDP
jgi:long-chain acyl-CoA synthetase